ncbi:MAG: S8 family serine peptidase [Cellulosilyticaceae bacterium]
MKKKIKIVILDSAIDSQHPYISDTVITQYNRINGKWIKEERNNGQGHGTAVCGIISRYAQESDIISFNILDDNLRTNSENLISALQYIYDNIECDIVNISLGLRNVNNNLYKVCKELNNKGVVLVAAFDNAGAISYPAEYSFVIGVDASLRCIHPEDFVFVKNGAVNIRAKGGNQKVAWVNPKFTINQGSSFATPYVTAYISKLISQGVRKDNILDEIEKVSQYVYEGLNEEINVTSRSYHKEYHNVAVYPYNKEIHSMINYPDLLDFKIKAIYDNKYSGKIKLGIESIDRRHKYIIKNIENIDWEEIDTIIVGHLKEVEMLSNKPLKKTLLEKCLKNNINVYCFDDRGMDEKTLRDFEEKGLTIDWPGKQKYNIKFNKFGKLYQIKSPILGIFGTTKQQGKFTLQLYLRRLLKHNGYNICQLGTEPSSKLFGMDEVYAFGYDGTVSAQTHESIETLNMLMHLMDIKEPDIILVGSQSGTIPMMYYNLGQLPMEQINFLMGTKADGIVLCVNISDSLEYINRTKLAIENMINCKVICLAIYPFKYTNGWTIISENKKEVGADVVNKFKEQILLTCGLKSFVIGNEYDMNKLFESCIDFFSEGEL